MSGAAMLDAHAMAQRVTGRARSLLAGDMETWADALSAAVEGRRVLIIGGAGSIGSATILTMVAYRPTALHVVDQNENELAELVRTLRSRSEGLEVRDFRTLPLDYGAPGMRLMLHTEAPYDIILNFAAIKHVRSEKDVFSMLQMFDTNFRKQAQLLRWLEETGFSGRFFSVSTDKAANPSSFMGASKRLMEHVMFSGEAAPRLKAAITSARFANVAYSNGSLLQSFGRRLAQNQPLAAPRDTRRYFVSLEESGQLCTLAGLLGPSGTIMVPKLNPEEHLVTLEDVATGFLDSMGYRPEIFVDEADARAAVPRLSADGRWPLLLTQLDTAGEKPFEEFVGEGEQTREIGLSALQGVAYKAAPPGVVGDLIARIEALFDQLHSASPAQALDRDLLKALVAEIEPDFLTSHRSSDKSLDQRV
jgi:FlaA1/EpsC-like NDP-sugar epimerase